ncbi:MAG: DNA-directed RNA polymerase subunit alpha [Patescibacteria group bacterium]
MEYAYLSSTVAIKTISEDVKHGVFEVEGLFAGYGLTVGNALRRALLSSLPGAAITELKIKNAPHEFSTLPGMKEDIIELSLNLKKLRFRMHTDEPQILTIKAKGIKTITAADIKMTSEVEIINPDEVIASLSSKDAEIDAEIKVERGLGYSPADQRQRGRLAIGTIAIDAIFTPVHRVNYTVSDMRVGERTDYNKLKIEIETDGTITPSAALHKSANILKDHFEKISGVKIIETEEKKEAVPAPKKKGRSKKSE